MSFRRYVESEYGDEPFGARWQPYDADGAVVAGDGMGNGACLTSPFEYCDGDEDGNQTSAEPNGFAGDPAGPYTQYQDLYPGPDGYPYYDALEE